jgi:hypothetical protein
MRYCFSSYFSPSYQVFITDLTHIFRCRLEFSSSHVQVFTDTKLTITLILTITTAKHLCLHFDFGS